MLKKLAIAAVLTHNSTATNHDIAPDFCTYDSTNFTWPHLACLIEQHNVSAFAKALEQGADPDMQDDTNTTRSLLWQSVYQISDSFYMTGQQPGTEMVDLLLQYNANPNTMASFRLESTPLMVASFFNNLTHVAKKLIDESPIQPDVNAKNWKNETALLFAASTDRYEVIPLLVKANANLEITSWLNFTPLLAATTSCNDQSSLALTSLGANIHARDDQKYTPLHNACWCYSPEVVSTLLAHKADIDAQDYLGSTPLMSAVWKEHPDIVQTLVDNKANVHIVNRQNDTALSYARALNNRKIINILLAAKAHVDSAVDAYSSQKDHSPLSKATAHNYAAEAMNN